MLKYQFKPHNQVSMPHRQDRSCQCGDCLIKEQIVSMPHRQDRSNWHTSGYAIWRLQFPCLIGRIGVGVYQQHELLVIISFPCLIGRIGVASLSNFFADLFGFHASQVGSEFAGVTDNYPPSSQFPCLIGRIGVPSFPQRFSRNLIKFPCLIGRIGVGNPFLSLHS